MYSNDTTQIRQGFTNYIGAIINSLSLPKEAAIQQTVAILVEEIMKLTKNENGLIDTYAIKPYISGIVKVLKQLIDEMEKSEEKNLMKDSIEDYKQVTEFFSDFLRRI